MVLNLSISCFIKYCLQVPEQVSDAWRGAVHSGDAGPGGHGHADIHGSRLHAQSADMAPRPCHQELRVCASYTSQTDYIYPYLLVEPADSMFIFDPFI